ncbi:MAG TPA: AmmeMemoRadiSam system protein B [Burkholderiales bacterium]|nr:AmmeMemoRadiSam system protein B [Burkholderiales bacterium]
MTATIRPAAVAGAFYPADPAVLARDVAALLDRAQARLEPGQPVPKAIIAPHAGYIYSGPVAATVYARLVPFAGRIRRVVLLGPAHRVAVRGLALPGATAFETPLGSVPVDEEGHALLQDLHQVVVSREAHALEHSLEVHLPFLQKVLGDFKLIPLVVGRAAPEEVAQVLERLWGGDETLVVVSSDLSHYLGYAQAQATDRDTARLILNRQPTLDPHQACGAAPANGLLLMAARRGLGPRLLDLRNSGDTAGDRSRVVGYGSFGFYADAAAAGDTPGDVLIPIARSAIGGIFGLAFRTREDPAFLHAHGACFVTLTRHGKLRGCIGTLQAHRKLLDDVKANAKAAAFLDPRFEPLTATEFKSTLVEISLLSVAEPIAFAGEAEAIAQLRPNLDGIILEFGSNRGTFLPQVWEQIPDPREFLAHLKRKAGLAPDFWADDVRLARYTVSKWKEAELPDPA